MNDKVEKGFSITKVTVISTIIWIILPFLLDKMADCGFIRYIVKDILHSNFDKETWFTFYGSYLPATAFGLIALYNASQIKKQQERIDELNKKYRFRLISGAALYKYNVGKKAIGDYYQTDLIRQVAPDSSAGIDFTKGYLLDFRLEDAINQATLDQINVKNIIWRIADVDYNSDYIEVMKAWEKGFANEISVYWVYRPNKDLEDEIKNCLDNIKSTTSSYLKSNIQLYLELILSDKSKYQLQLEFSLSHRMNQDKLVAVGHRCIVE